MSSAQPEGFTIRPATLSDVSAVYGLLQSYERALYGCTDKILAYVQAAYSEPSLNFAQDTCLVFNRAGQLVGSMLLEQSGSAHFSVTVCVFPPESDTHLCDYLLSKSVSRAQTRMALSQQTGEVTLSSWVSSIDQDSLQSYERAGFEEVRRNWRMEIELNDPPAQPARPQGVELRPFVPERDDRMVFEMMETVFQDYWDYAPQEFAAWRFEIIEQAACDPSLSFLAWADDQVVGAVLCNAGPPGWVDSLAVTRAFRGRGLGLALLLHAFDALYHRGLRRVGLAVDSHNLTGATRLYQRAGMRKTRAYLNMQKVFSAS